VKPRFKIADWINPYHDRGMDCYSIPTYKVERLMEVEKESESLKEQLQKEQSDCHKCIDLLESERDKNEYLETQLKEARENYCPHVKDCIKNYGGE